MRIHVPPMNIVLMNYSLLRPFSDVQFHYVVRETGARYNYDHESYAWC